MYMISSSFQIIYADIGTEGGSNDSGIFNRCTLNEALRKGDLNLPPIPSGKPEVPYHFIADDAFALNEHVMKPFPNKSLEAKERVFNYRFSRARRCVENAFGIMSAR